MSFMKHLFKKANKFVIHKYHNIKGYNKIVLGNRFYANRFFRCEVFNNGQLFIGDNVAIGESVHIGVVNLIEIEDNVLLGSRILITDHNHGSYNGENQSSPITPPNLRKLTTGLNVKIKKNVWIGDGVIVLPGVTIGAGSIVGSNSVVNKSLPDNCIAGGVPAKVLKVFDEVEQKWKKIGV